MGVGIDFTVYPPKADRPAEAEVHARRAASLRFGTGRILLMDDDPSISTLTGKMLKSLDYKYDLAKDGEDALALYRRYLNIGRSRLRELGIRDMMLVPTRQSGLIPWQELYLMKTLTLSPTE